MNNTSQNLFDSCVFKVNKDINWNKTALEEIKNNLLFEVTSHDPLTITRKGLSEEVFAKLTKTLMKCISPCEGIKFKSEHFEDIHINEDLDPRKEDSCQPENEPENLKCISEKQKSATLENAESLKEGNSVLNILNHNHETNNSGLREDSQSENSSASFVVLKKEEINLKYAGNTGEDNFKRDYRENKIKIGMNKYDIEQIENEEKCKEESYKKDKKEKNTENVPYLEGKEYDFKKNSLLDTKARTKFNDESKKKTLMTEENKEESIQHHYILNHKDVLQKAQCVTEEEATMDQTEASGSSVSGINQRSYKRVNQNVNEFRTNNFEKDREINPLIHQSCESASFDCEHSFILHFNETNFKAAKHYFKDNKVEKYLSRAKYMNNIYVIEIDKKDKTLKYFKILRNFKSFILTDVDETEAFRWEQLLQDKFSNIKTLFTPLKRILQIMGPEDKLSASKSLIISLRGNKDHEMMWSKPSNEMKDSSINVMKSQSPESCNPSHLETGKYSPLINNDSTRERYFSDREGQNYKIVENFKLRAKDQMKPSHIDWPHIRKIISGSQGVVSLGNNLKVKVCKADITKLNFEIIVNAANRHLEHKGGVALAIAEAAGSQLQKECKDFIKKHKALEVTGVFVSSGGNLKARKVIHAVGPKWDCYEDKNKCSEDLRHTLLRCLVEASRQGAANIAFPSISAAIFKVPPELCAENYMAAVKHFDCIRQELQLTSLQEIMFVDVKDDLVNIIQEKFCLKWKHDPDKDLMKEDLNFAKNIPKLDSNLKVKISSQAPKAKPIEIRPSSSFSRAIGTKATAEGKTYEHKSLKINVCVKPALTSFNELVFVVGEPFDLLSGLHNFSVKKDIQEDKKANRFEKLKSFKSMYLGKTSIVYSLKCKLTDKEEMEKALDNLAFMDLSYLSDQKDISLVITSEIFYSGKTQNDFKLISALAAALHKFIQNVSKNMCVKHVRIAANEDALTSVIKVFDSRTDLKEVKNAEHINKDKPRDTYFYGEHKPLEKRLSGDGQTSISQGRLASDNLKSGREQLTLYHSSSEAQGESSVDDESLCQICLVDKCYVPLNCCHKNICRKCKKKCTQCPFCRKIFGILRGNQPDGEMKVQFLNAHAAGFENCHVWEITYTFLSGIQKEFHPSPGQFYSGITRTAYLPNSKEGYDVLLRLKIAFMRRLTFAIGHSVTLNMDNKITWNDIHHKTSLNSGSHGYPDSSYLMRVAQELTDKGVTLESMTPEENKELDKFKHHLHTSMNVLRYPSH